VTDHDLHTLTGAYALDALDDTERRLFQAHLAECDSCQQEVAGLTATAARLGGALAVAAPPGLRVRVLAQVATTRQLPPATGVDEHRTAVPWFRQPLAVAASFLLVVAVGLGAFAVSENRRADQAEQLASRITAVVTDPDRVEAQRPVSSGGTSTLIASGGRAVFSATGLASLPGDRTYQLWVIDQTGARSVGVLGRAEAGGVTRFVAQVRSTDTIGLTIEPKGGSRAPTTDPIVAIPVRA
jgi:Anti-sigma-K factor rskA/Putative zinc-finger